LRYAVGRSDMSVTRRLVIAIAAVLAVTAAVELWMGRLPLGPDGRFGWLEPDIWSSSQSQRLLDPYSVTHLIHGFLFYFLIWLVARRAPISTRFLAAVVLEAGWEILENSPIVIDRYRAVTIAQGYVGDSVLNSLSDIAMAAVGFLMAWRLRLSASLAFIVASELIMVMLIRDNLTLNIVMLVFPLEAIRAWQMEGHD
jgi:hypothetical protein